MDRWQTAALRDINLIRQIMWDPYLFRATRVPDPRIPLVKKLPKGFTLVSFDPISLGVFQDVITNDLEIMTWPVGWGGQPDGVCVLCGRIEGEYTALNLSLDGDHFLKRFIAGYYPELEY